MSTIFNLFEYRGESIRNTELLEDKEVVIFGNS